MYAFVCFAMVPDSCCDDCQHRSDCPYCSAPHYPLSTLLGLFAPSCLSAEVPYVLGNVAFVPWWHGQAFACATCVWVCMGSSFPAAHTGWLGASVYIVLASVDSRSVLIHADCCPVAISVSCRLSLVFMLVCISPFLAMFLVVIINGNLKPANWAHAGPKWTLQVLLTFGMLCCVWIWTYLLLEPQASQSKLTLIHSANPTRICCQ